jgi:hypothetical protein
MNELELIVPNELDNPLTSLPYLPQHWHQVFLELHRILTHGEVADFFHFRSECVVRFVPILFPVKAVDRTMEVTYGVPLL